MGQEPSKEKKLKRLENQLKKHSDNEKIKKRLENNISAVKSQK